MDFRTGLKSFFSGSGKRKALFSLFSLAFLIAVLPLLVTAARYQQELRKLAVGELADTASLSLVPSPTQVNIDDPVAVEVRLDTGGQAVYAVDIIIINSSPGILRLDQITPNPASGFNAFVPWTAGSQNFDSSGVISAANSTGQIEFGAVVFDPANPEADPYTSPVNGNNILIATLGFEGLSLGTSSLSFVFNPANPNETTDSNVVAVVRPDIVDDILGSVDSTAITVFSSGVPTLAPTPTPTSAPTPTPSLIPSPTPTLEPGTSQVNFKLKFQGVNVWRSPQTIKVTIKKGETIIDSFDVLCEADDTGAYHLTSYNIALGTYDFLIKGPSHLQRKFEGVVLDDSGIGLDWSATRLLAGDAYDDNKINIFDVTILSQDFGSRMPAGGSRADFDFDNDVDIFDLVYISENFGLGGDQ
jgi:hypothetical protein